MTAILMSALLGTASAQVYRCGSSYSSEPCQGGREVDISPTLSDPRGAATREIFMCRSDSNRYSWNAEHCAKSGGAVERIARVPRNASWQDQVQMAQDQRVSAEALARATHPSAGSANTVEPSSKDVCQQLEERIQGLDRRARVNSTPWITEERRLARDRQFRLRC